MPLADHHDQRPSPEALLAVAQRGSRARLKVFLGAASGVGKTFACLQEARLRQREGIDVVVGIVETHGRTETKALLDGLEVLPRKRVEYRGHVLEEMDLDAVLARKPQLVLVDELAHTNAPGSRHPKRWQDVEEIIAAGIDVFTTVNVQHLESLNDAVAQITGVRVRETLPDRLLDRAEDIQLIDLPPDELIGRLLGGKVYVPDQAARAIEHYFRPGNLNALRELALRRTADRVDDQMHDWMQARAIPGPWPATERIMVCISPAPSSPRLIRAAKRRADRRHAKWMAVYVETPGHARLSEEERDRVASTLRMAEQLGGEAVTISGHHPADDLIRYAQERNATEIIIGKSHRFRWDRLRYGSVVNDLIRRSSDIDVLVITGEDSPPAHAGQLHLPVRSGRKVGAYLASTAAVIVSALAAKVLGHYLSLPNLSLVFLLAVLLSAVRYGLWPSIYAATLSALIFNFFFIEPLYTFTIAHPQEALAYAVYFIVAIITGNLAARVREQAEAARRREDRTAALFALSKAVAGSAGLDTTARAIAEQVGQILAAHVVVLVPTEGRLVMRASMPTAVQLTDREQAAATWAWEHGQPAGQGSDTLPGVPWLFLPLKTANSIVGVVGIQFKTPATVMPLRRQRLLEGLADQAAIAIERTRLVEEMERTRVLTASEKLRAALLASVSHDLRTPLASIIGSASSLLSFGENFDEAARRDLVATIHEEAQRLNRFVGNLLDITRLESGKLELNREWIELADVVGSALSRMEVALREYTVEVMIPAGLPLLRVDFVLTEQVFVNLLENAAKYSPPGTRIRIRAQQEGKEVLIEIADEGIGIPPGDLERVFDKFYRIRSGDRQEAGTGLGLSICRGIVEAHGGKITASLPPEEKGTVFTLRLPIEDQPPSVTEPSEP